MKLEQLKNEDVTLLSPLQNDGKFAIEERPKFWNSKTEYCNTYKIYLIGSYLTLPRSETLFLVDTGAVKCVFRGRFNK